MGDLIDDITENISNDIRADISTNTDNITDIRNLNKIPNITENLVNVSAVLVNIVLNAYNPDPYKRPGQKKQGREKKNKSRKKPNWEPRNGTRRPKKPKSHTPGKDHRKYNVFYDLIDLLSNIF